MKHQRQMDIIYSAIGVLLGMVAILFLVRVGMHILGSEAARPPAPAPAVEEAAIPRGLSSHTVQLADGTSVNCVVLKVRTVGKPHQLTCDWTDTER